jgi:hypothetical protein
MLTAFQHDRYLLVRQLLALTGTFRLYAQDGSLALFSRQKLLRMREDIRIYADEGMQQEILLIQARHILDFSAAYDVVDSTLRQRVGVLRRKGFRSLLRDEWEVLDAGDNLLGLLVEDDVSLAVMRRFLLGRWLPQNYDLLIGGSRAADLRQRFNLFRYELDLEFIPGGENRLDRRLGIAAAILLATIEGRQD